MKLSTSSSSLLLVLSAFATALQAPSQRILADTSTSKVEVVGRNSAYYTQVDKEDQLFKVHQLVVYPDRPAINEYYFAYLSGVIMGRPQGLEDAILKVSGACPDYYEIEMKVVDWYKKVRVRHGWEYGGPLTWGPNEVLFDSMMILWPPFVKEKWNCSVEATSWLPDQRVIFSYAQNFTLQFPKEEDECNPRPGE